jgi:glycine betaine/proline transport system permease protein
MATSIKPAGRPGGPDQVVTEPWAGLRSILRTRKPAVTLAVAAGVIVLILVTGGKGGLFTKPPTWLDLHVKPWVDARYKWVVLNNQKHWIFTGFFDPFSSGLKQLYAATHWLLVHLRWPGVLALTGVIGWKTGGRSAAIIGMLSLVGCGVLGYWDDTMISLSLMILAVLLSVLVGVPLGIWAGLNDRVDSVLRGVLDVAQVLPAYVYLLPIVVLFGIGNAGAVIATFIFAVAPAVRLTSHGIRSVPVVATEVGTSFGSTRRQLLGKVQLPLSRTAMLLGLNQVIMMAFGLLVIAALIGAGGLGLKVYNGLQQANVGKSFPPGLAMVFAAVALDRITTGSKRARSASERSFLPPAFRRAPAWWALALGSVIVIAAVSRVVGISSFPKALQVNVTPAVNSVVDWVKSHVRKGVPLIGGTQSISDFLVVNVLSPIRDRLQFTPWWASVVLVGALGWWRGGRRLGVLCGLCMVGIAALRTWDLAMDTLSQVLLAVVISVVLAVPIGIFAGRSDRFERILRPILDAMQVMPGFVYLVPVVFLFDVGRMPGVIASVIYALPPGIRLTSLGLREVSYSVREAAMSFGATPRQELVKVQLPLALRSVMLGINQTILMVLSMVVVAALIGAGALGLETVYGLTKKEIGRGVAGGVSIVLLAIVLDRITQTWGSKRSASTRRTAA